MQLHLTTSISALPLVALSFGDVFLCHKIAYVEPVATDPAFYRMGLGKAAVLEGIKRCGELGATVAFVGSEQKFYEAIGFEKISACYAWLKYFDIQK